MPTTPFFKEFGPLLFGRPKLKLQKRLERLRGLEDLYKIFGDLLPQKLLEPSEAGLGSRERKLPLSVTFWAFLSQVLSPRSSCRDAVQRIEAWWRYEQTKEATTLTTGAYIQARQRLQEPMLRLILGQTAWQLDRNILKAQEPLNKRRVLLVDGTSISMPDTVENQREWPQPGSQKPGCGFPLMTFVGVFSLASGGLQHYATGNHHEHESVIFKSLHQHLRRDDVLVEDRGYCSYGAIVGLLKRGVDTVARLHQARSTDMRQGKPLGTGDRLVVWRKPLTRPAGQTPEEFAQLPQEQTLRLIKIEVTVPGFRTRQAVLVTTLLDPVEYPADTLRDLYRRRWGVEQHFAQIKTLLGTDILRCQTPEMIHKELLIHLIAYNLVRTLMQRSAQLYHVPLQQISFKGTLDAVRHYAQAIRAAAKNPRKQAQLINQLLERIATDTNPIRPHRYEPRAQKRRPKNYQNLTHPRAQMKIPPHRNRPKNKTKNMAENKSNAS